MRLLLCWLFPPLAVLSCGKPFTAALNFVFMCFFWMPGVWHAQAVVENYYNEKRNKKLIRAIDYPAWAQHVFAAPKKDERMRLPKMKKQKMLVQAEDEEAVYNDPVVGENGTRFRRRG